MNDESCAAARYLAYEKGEINFKSGGLMIRKFKSLEHLKIGLIGLKRGGQKKSINIYIFIIMVIMKKRP